MLAILNRLLLDGLITTQEMPIKGGSSEGLAGGLLLYGVKQYELLGKMGRNIAKSIFNVSMATGGKLGKLTEMTLEMNNLLF